MFSATQPASGESVASPSNVCARHPSAHDGAVAEHHAVQRGERTRDANRAELIVARTKPGVRPLPVFGRGGEVELEVGSPRPAFHDVRVVWEVGARFVEQPSRARGIAGAQSGASFVDQLAAGRARPVHLQTVRPRVRDVPRLDSSPRDGGTGSGPTPR
jgi:hypothetical protein